LNAKPRSNFLNLELEMLDHSRPLNTRLPDMLRNANRLRGVFSGIPSPALVEM
jgi:4-hydroxy-2-oxoheptanedioate aldolase